MLLNTVPQDNLTTKDDLAQIVSGAEVEKPGSPLNIN